MAINLEHRKITDNKRIFVYLPLKYKLKVIKWLIEQVISSEPYSNY